MGGKAVELERKHLRLPAEHRVYIETGASDGEDDSTIDVCNTLDVSVNGLRLALGHELPVGAYLHLGVETTHPDASQSTLILVAVVRWCCPRETEDGPWLAGLEVQPAQGSDYQRWEELVAGLVPV